MSGKHLITKAAIAAFWAKHWKAITGGAAAIAIAIGLFALLKGPYDYAVIAVNFGAKQTCSCLNISNRGAEDCLSDFPDEAREYVKITSYPNGAVRASIYGLVSAKAAYSEDYGCTITK